MSTPTLLKIGFVKASWHAEIVGRALLGFTEAMPNSAIDVVSVPGAFELPLAARRLARTGRYDAIVCAAFVVNGGIYHNEFVSQAVVEGLLQVSLATDVPVLSVSLTPHNYQENEPMTAFFLENFVTKGKEAAEAVLGVLAAHGDIASLEAADIEHTRSAKVVG